MHVAGACSLGKINARSVEEAEKSRLPFRQVVMYCAVPSTVPRPALSPAQTQKGAWGYRWRASDKGNP